MMKKNYCVSGLLTLMLMLGSMNVSFGQSGTIKDFGVQSWDLNKSTFALKELKYNSKLIGSRYLYEDYMVGIIYLAGDTVEVHDAKMRINLQMHTLEVLFNGEARSFPYYLIDHFKLTQTGEVFYTQSGLNNADVPMGFYKELYREDSGLYCFYATTVKEAYYNPAIDAGRKDDQLIQTTTYYALIDDQMMELERSKSKRMKQFGSQQPVMQFIKEKDIDVRTEQGMIAVMNFIDAQNQ